QRVLVPPHPPGQLPADDGHAGRAELVGGGERTPAHRDPERAEVVAGDHPVLDRGELAAARWQRPVPEHEVLGPAASPERQAGDGPGGANARHPPHPGEELVEEDAGPLGRARPERPGERGVLVLRRRKVELRAQEPPGLVPEVDLEQLMQALQGQPRSGQQDEGEGRLCDDQRGAEARPKSTAVAREATTAKARIGHSRPMGCRRGSASWLSPFTPWRIPSATTTPTAPPTTPSTRLSTRSWRSSALRLAPSAARMTISLRRPAPRTSWR